MSKKQGVLRLILFACALGVLAWLVRPSREPVYQGKPLSAWLKSMENWAGNTNDAAFVAFREMGTNAIPPLLSVIQSGGPAIQRMILKLNQKQSLIKLPFGTPWHQSMAACWALYAMGTNAKPALPVLTNLLFHSNAIITSTTVLAGIGSVAVPVLITALTNQDYRIRHSAANGLGWERSDFNVVVPALIASLQDSNRIVRGAAINSLGHLHAEPEMTVPALMNVFSNNDVLGRRSVLISLGQFNADAKESVPMILSSLKDKDVHVRLSAAYALKHIDPETATRVGVK